MKKFNLLINNVPSCEAITSGEFNSKEEADKRAEQLKSDPAEFAKLKEKLKDVPLDPGH